MALCRLLLSRPDLLLLDEPTNHLDAESVDWLEQFLQDYAGTVVAITHDRYFLDNVARWILELDRGRGIPFEGNYSSWLEQKQERLAREERSNEARRRTLERELEWVRMAPKARQAKGKARLAAYDKLHAEAEAARGDGAELEIAIPPGPRLGDAVIEVDALRKGYGDRLLIEDLSFTLPRAGIVGVIGPNGAGKTTLFRMLTGQEPADAGAITIGDTVQLELRRPVARQPGRRRHRVPGDHGRCRPPQGRQPRGPRPGLRRQLQLQGRRPAEAGRRPVGRRAQPGAPGQAAASPAATCCCSTSRPTISTSTRCGRWRPALESFPGCAVVISHDRWFLDRIATHVLAFEGDSQVRWFEGNFTEYEEWRHKELGAAADQPHRIKYKKLAS